MFHLTAGDVIAGQAVQLGWWAATRWLRLAWRCVSAWCEALVLPNKDNKGPSLVPDLASTEWKRIISVI